MTEPYQQFDHLFTQSARLAFSADAVPYAELFRAANMGFDQAFGNLTLSRHAWLAYLNRLWDSPRIGGLPTGPIRVPEKIWQLAEGESPQARLHQALLEATGLKLPQDFGQDLAFHLTLWSQDALAGAVRSAETLDEATSTQTPTADLAARAEGPISLDISPTTGGFLVEFTPELPGAYHLSFHWPDGSAMAAKTPPLSAGQSFTFQLETDHTEPPKSVKVVRRHTS
ncbi:MAG: hypothetical protein FWG16_00825 [Micrococcales bacterium]|nr:hypothetical protein [Micrococcales bacterium]